MFHKLVNWYAGLEQEHLTVLERPEVAAQLAPGLRRCMALKLAKLSPIERQQLHAFSVKYRGRNLVVVLLKWMLAFSAVGAAFHLVYPVAAGIVRPVIIANLFGLALLWVSVSAMFNYRELLETGLRRFALWFGIAMAIALTGVAAGAAVAGRPMLDALRYTMGGGILAGMATAALLLLPIGAISVLRNRQYLALMAQMQHDAERERLARELSESRLRMLRAQIEPHFLFNTLGAVQQLAEQGAPRAAELTANLIAFLRASLAEMRAEQVSLEAEFSLVQAYLTVMQVRLGQRLRFTLTLPAPLRSVQLPGMILLTLVENAIKHGIEPSLRGGEIAVTAAADAATGQLRLRVHDSGVGLADTPGDGLGIDNVRTRLQLAYGAAAVLTLEAADEGVLAEITLPLAAMERASA